MIFGQILLDTRTNLEGVETSFLNYVGALTVLQSVYADLAEEGIAEIEIMRWRQIAGAIERPVVPATKRASERVQQYEIGVRDHHP